MTEFDFLLEDRIAKIQAINEEYDLEHNSYISFSGGKDSTILHYLVDLALPGNKIPRVFANTGLEYLDIVKFVKDLSKNDNRFIILKQTKNIPKTLREYGYPFKSKEFALRVSQFNKGSNANFLKKYLDANTHSKFACPKILRFIFDKKGKYNYSNLCCYKLKKALLKDWQKEHNIKMAITGMRNEEGGNRERLTCLTNKATLFHPLIVVNEEWENWFIENQKIKICKLYYPPYNFTRTGCKGCPFSLTLQHDLDVMELYLPNEKKQCEILWKPVYNEYRRIGYRLKPIQITIFDFINHKGDKI